MLPSPADAGRRRLSPACLDQKCGNDPVDEMF
jgi:hypothetical protein